MLLNAVQKFLHFHVDLCRLIGCVNIIGPLREIVTVEKCVEGERSLRIYEILTRIL